MAPCSPRVTTRVALRICHFPIPPAQLAAELPITPDQMWAKGDTNPFTGRPHKENMMEFDSGAEEASPLNEHVAAIVGRIETGVIRYDRYAGTTRPVFFAGLFCLVTTISACGSIRAISRNSAT